MNLVDRLRAERNVPPAIRLQFDHQYRPGQHDRLYAFFEGRDDHSFYMPELRRRWNGSRIVIPFDCRGKKGVIDAYRDIQMSGKTANLAFFVDKDVDDLLGLHSPNDQRIYETECYSIENYMVSEEILEIIWIDIFHLSIADQRLKLIKDEFTAQHQRFVQLITPLMAWIILLRLGNVRCNLSDINLAKIFYFDENLKLHRRPKILQTLHDACGISNIGVDPKYFVLLLSIIRLLKKLNPKAYVRGKFELWFFVSYILRLQAALSARLAIPGSRAVVTTSLCLANAIEILAARTPYPARLRNFLDRLLTPQNLLPFSEERKQ